MEKKTIRWYRISLPLLQYALLNLFKGRIIAEKVALLEEAIAPLDAVVEDQNILSKLATDYGFKLSNSAGKE